MKYLVLIPYGMADEPISSLDNKTPMQAAKKPCMDMLAAKSVVGTVSNVPEGMVPESDTANMAILSFDPKVYSRGRSPLEAVSMGLTMADDDVAYHCNVVTLSDGGDYDDKIMLDHSADEITTEEADELIRALDAALGDDIRRFYTGVSYRHCILWKGGCDTYQFMRPHDILGQPIKDYLPKGEDGKVFYDLMRASWDILEHHPVNEARRARGLRPANSIWLWSPGKKPALPSFKDKWGLDGTVISAVDLIKGIGLCAGMKSVDVEGATGNVHTNYDGKAAAAIKAFEDGADYVYIHVEAPDECGHRAELENKVLSVELIDEKILKPVYEYLCECGDNFKIMVLPDHPTPVRIRTHTIYPVPFMIYSSDSEVEGVSTFDEQTAAATGLYVDNGFTLMERLVGKADGEGEKIKKNKSKRTPAPWLTSIFDVLEIFALSMIAVLVIFTFCFRLCRVQGDSMNKTLQNKEMLITTNLFYTPKCGDIIVFHLSNDVYREPLVKRVIGVEGQTVRIDFTKGEVSVDGRVLDEDYAFIEGGAYEIHPDFDRDFITLDNDAAIWEITVPDGKLFVMGDNRNNSSDSRSVNVGLVDVDTVLGKALLRISPFTVFD
jgi:2,3-bisphosphoglycerate-independent phosphoglycerate mutase